MVIYDGVAAPSENDVHSSVNFLHLHAQMLAKFITMTLWIIMIIEVGNNHVAILHNTSKGV